MELVEIMRNALRDSIKETMATIFASEPKFIEGEPAEMHNYDLTCSIGFAGGLEGSVIALFKKQDAALIVAKMLGMDVNDVAGDVVDGIGEVLNMISGGIKNRLDAENYSFDINIPTVVNGHELNVLVGAGVTMLKVMVNIENFGFGMILSYKAHEAGKEPSKFAARKASIKSDDLLKNLIAKDKQP